MTTTNTAAREVVLVPRELPHGLYLTSCQPHNSYGESWSAYYQKWWDNILEKVTLTQQQGDEQEAACSVDMHALENARDYLAGRFGEHDGWAGSIRDAIAALRSKQPAASDNLFGLRNEEGMLSGAELETLIDAAQTTTDNKTVAFLGQVSRGLLQQLHGVESALLAVGKRPPLCDTENAVRFAVGMPWVTNGEKK